METTVVEALGNDIIKSMDTLAKPKIGAFRIYYEGRLLQMASKKCQWSSAGAAKNALHNMIDEYLYCKRAGDGKKIKYEIYDYIMSKVEIRQCCEEGGKVRR